MTGQDTGILGIAKFVCGVLGVVLFTWTPQTGRGFLIYGVLIVVIVMFLVFIVSPSEKRKEVVYWSKGPKKE
jgi:hypothetical protein